MHEPDSEKFKGCVVVTGANRGIGQAVALVFAKNGFDLILTCRTKTDDFISWCDKIATDHKVSITIEVVDVSNLESIKELNRRIANYTPKPTVLVNNAGMAFGALVQMTPANKIQEMMDVNFFGTLFISQGLSRVLGRANGSVIVNISSASSLHPQSGMGGYGATKVAVNYLTKVLALELEALHIRVFAIAPGVTETDMLKQVDPKALAELLTESPTGRPSLPSEVAELIFSLTATDTKFRSGDIIEMHGGEIINVH